MDAAALTAHIHKKPPIAELGAMLDGLDPAVRRAAVTGLGRGAQKQLWALAADAEPLDLEYFAPSNTELKPIPHYGVNTLFMPLSLRKFAKVMARDKSGYVVGYNASPLGPIIGPGYYQMRTTEGDEQKWGAVVVDYYLGPQSDVPEGWPWVRPNWLGLQLFVYHQTRDYMRRVSDHVSIGIATKWGFELSNWFMLCKDPE